MVKELQAEQNIKCPYFMKLSAKFLKRIVNKLPMREEPDLF